MSLKIVQSAEIKDAIIYGFSNVKNSRVSNTSEDNTNVGAFLRFLPLGTGCEGQTTSLESRS